jgi:hypothetical protein
VGKLGGLISCGLCSRSDRLILCVFAELLTEWQQVDAGRLHRETFDNNLEAWQNAGWVGTRANVIKQRRLAEQRALKSSVVAKLADALA